LTYGDSRSDGNGGGRIIDNNYQYAVDPNGKAQLVLSYVTDKSSEYCGHATVVFRGTDPTLKVDLLRDIQYLTTSTECFKNNDDTTSSGSDVYGTTDGTGFFEALQSAAQNPLGPQVHRGFAKRTLAYTRWVQDKLCQEGCFPPEKVTDRWDEGGIGNLTKLYVTGHSLGGAAALAFAYWVKLAFNKTNPDLIVHVYVFSAPNVGNAAWAKEYNEMLGDTTFQHNYGPDVVPQFPPWLWKVGHEVSLEHKTTDGFLGLTGKPTSTAQSAEPWPENMSVDDMSVNFPLDYHLGLDRIFVPYYQHLEPGCADEAWNKYSSMSVLLETKNEDGSSEVKFTDTEWGQKLKPSTQAIGPVNKGAATISDENKRKPHFTMDDIDATWSFPSREKGWWKPYEYKNAALTFLNLAVQVYVLACLAEPLLAQAAGITKTLLTFTGQVLLAGAPLALLMLGTPAVAVFINLLIQRNYVNSGS